MPAKTDEKDKKKILEAINNGIHGVPEIAKHIGRSAQTTRRLVKVMAADRIILLTDKTPPYYYCELKREFNYHDPFNLCSRSRRVLAEDQDTSPDVLPAEATEQDRGSSEDSRGTSNDCFSALSYYQTRHFEGYGQPKQLRDIL